MRPAPLRPAHELRKYGLTQEDFEALWRAQAGRCAVCERPFNNSRRAQIDHDHRTGIVRGLLCKHCNRTIGYLHDDARWFTRAGEYLEVPVSVAVFDTPRRHRDAPPLEETNT